MSASPRPLLAEWRPLADRIADGTASPGDAARLSELLRERPDLRDAYLGYLDTHALLCWEFRSGVDESEAREAGAARAAAAPRASIAAWLPWGMAIGATIIAAFALLRPAERVEAEPSASVVASTGANDAPKGDWIAALLVDEAGAEFAPGREPDGVRIGPGEYELLKGVVHLRFAQGADLILAGPAKLAVTDALHVRLAYGKVRVIAPPTAKGFTVATPDADYVDLGTEFGLKVELDAGTSDLYVFDGQVNIADSRTGTVLSEVFEGKSSRCVRGDLTGATPELKESDFPNPGAIGFERWQAYERSMSDDRGLLGFFPFRRTDDETVLKNAQHAPVMADGRIAGTRWTSGRWPGKDALLFDRNTDFVELDIAGEHRDLSIAVWLKVDRLDFELNAILNSDSSEPGDVHFQLTRQGLPRGGLLGLKVQDDFVGNPVQLGKWAHVAIVISTADHTQRIYVNGELSRDRRSFGDDLIRPARCRLGNWLTAAGWTDTCRALRGRVDELAIWNRALTQAELKRLVEASRPELLWNEESTEVAAHR